MSLEQLIVMHNAAIGAMNDARAAIDRIEDALRAAKAAHAAAVKNEALLSAAVTAADRIARGVS